MPTRKKQPVRKVCFGAVQMISTADNIEANITKALRYCDRAARRGVQILCFPETATTGLDFVRHPRQIERIRKVAEPVPGPIVRRFAEKARDTNMTIVMGTVERPRRSRAIYNTAFLVGPKEGYIGKYRKVYTEACFKPGDTAPVFDTAHARIGIFICADMRSPELARLLAFRGAQVFLQPTAYCHPDKPPRDIRKAYVGKTVSQRTRAMDNGLPLVCANAGRPEYVNNTRIIAPDLQGPEPLLAKATRKEQLITADVPIRDRPTPQPANLARKFPWLYRQLANEMRNAANTRR